MTERLPTLPGYVHGIVGVNPTRLQCDGCGAIETPEHLVLMKTKFAGYKDRGRDKRRLCPPCQNEAGWTA